MSLSKLESEKLINELFNKIKGLQSTLQRPAILQRSNIMDALLKILSKVATHLTSSGDSRSDDLRYKASQILGEVLSGRCAPFQFQLKLYIGQEFSYKAEDKIRHLCNLFHTLLLVLPDSSWSNLLIDELKCSVQDPEYCSTIENLLIL